MKFPSARRLSSTSVFFFFFFFFPSNHYESIKILLTSLHVCMQIFGLFYNRTQNDLCAETRMTLRAEEPKTGSLSLIKFSTCGSFLGLLLHRNEAKSNTLTSNFARDDRLECLRCGSKFVHSQLIACGSWSASTEANCSCFSEAKAFS